MRLALLTIGICLVLVAPASAVQLVNPDGSVAQPYQAWADAAKVPTPQREIVVTHDTTICNGRYGCADAGWIYFEAGTSELHRQRFMHELGHLFDFKMLDDDARGKLQRLMGFARNASWWGGFSKSPQECFAEVYRIAALYGSMTAFVAARSNGAAVAPEYDCGPYGRAFKRELRLIHRAARR